MILSILSLLSLALSAVASYSIKSHPHPEELTPGLRDLGPIDLRNPIYKYLGDGKGKSRCPCPFLNTMANHGVLPYDGKNIHMETYRLAAYKGGFSKGMFSFSLRSSKKIAQKLHDDDVKAGKPNPHPLDRLDMWELGIHGPIEHDYSLTRWDVDLPNQDANDRVVDPDLVKQMLDKYGNHPDGCYLTKHDLALWRKDRIAQEEKRAKRKPDWSLPAQVAAAGEAVFVTKFMGKDHRISCANARTFFLEQRLPDDYKPPSTMHLITFIPRMTAMLLEVHGPRAAADFGNKVDEAQREMYPDPDDED